MSDTYGSGLNLTPSSDASASADSANLPDWAPQSAIGPAGPQQQQQQPGGGSTFGGSLMNMLPGPRYTPPDPQASALDQSAGLLDQRIKRASSVATNPLAQIFAPDQVQAARDFVPAATQQLQQVKAQQQHAIDIKQTARNWNLTNPNQFGEQATDVTLANEALRQWKDEGNFNAYKALSGLSPEWKNRADLYMPDAMSKFGAHVTAVQDGIKTLNGAAAVNSEQAFTAARARVIKDNDLGALGIKESSIPTTIDGWLAQRGSLEAQYNVARRTLNAFAVRQDQLNQAVPITDEKVGKQIEGTYQFGNGEAIPGFKAVSLPGYGDVQGVMGPPGSRDTANRGVTWSNAAPEQIKTVREQLSAEEVKGALAKYKIAREFNATAQNDKLYRSAAGIALLSDELGAIGRDVAEGSKAAGTVGLTKMLEAKYGTIDNARNRLNLELSALQEWRKKGGETNPRLSPPSIAGIREVAQFKHDQALKEAQDRISQPLETAGRYGMQLKNLGIDKELSESPELRATYDSALRQGNRELDSYPMVTIGDRRVLLPSGSNIAGAKVAPLDHGPEPTPGGVGPQQNGNQPQNGNQTTPPGGQAGGVQQPAPLTGQAGGAGSPPGRPNGGWPQPSQEPGRYGLPPGMSLDAPGAVAAAANRTIQIESGFAPGAKTGSYVGLGQWSKAELARHGITNPDDLEQNRAALQADIRQRAAKLQQDGLPATAANVYLMHQQGEAGLEAHLRNPNAPAWQNMASTGEGRQKGAQWAKQAIWGNMTPEMRRQFPGGVNTVTSGDFTRLWEARYNGTDGEGGPKGSQQAAPGAGGALAGIAGRAALNAVPGGMLAGAAWDRLSPEQKQRVKDLATENAPAIGSVAGATAGGMLGGPPGGIAGGALGGGAGQAVKDYVQGNPQSPREIAKQTALGGVLGVASEARPVAAFATRVLGAGGVELADEAAKGGETDLLAAGAKGAAYALGGEALGRFVSSAGAGAFKALSRYTTSAQRDLSGSAGKLAEARQVLETEQPKLPGDAGPNPKYEVAKKQADDATAAIKDHGQNPDDMVHAYEQAKAGVSAGEAATMRKAQSEKTATSQGYNQLREDVRGAGVGAPKANQPVPDGPLSRLRTADNMTGSVPEQFRPEAEHAEMLIKAPAKDWGEKWQQLQNAGTELIEKRMAFLAGGDKPSAKAMDNLFEGVREQQRGAARYVFGEDKGKQIIDRLESLDKSWARIMNATQGMDYGKMRSVLAQGNTPERRELEKNFREFAKDDPSAIRAFNAMKAGARGDWKSEASLMVPIIAGEAAANLHGVPTLGAISAAVGGYRLIKLMQGYVNAKTLGTAVTFKDFLAKQARSSGVLNATGDVARRGVTQGQPDAAALNAALP